jgi:lipopolysaccharide export system permease protein
MRLSRILSRYVLWEILLYATIGLVAVGSILVTQNLLRRLDELAAVGFAARDAAALLACLFAMLAAYAVPVAFLFGILVAVGRLSADSEITAMRSCGVGTRELVLPPLFMGVVVCVLTAYLLIEVEPLARRELRSVLSSIASRGALVEPGRFNTLDRSGSRLLLVQSKSEDDGLEGVMISDRSDAARPFMVFAERGHFVFQPERLEIHLVLETGAIHFEPSGMGDERYRRINFEKLDYAIDAGPLLAADPSRIRPREMTLQEIHDVLDYFDAHDGKPPEAVRIKTREPYEIQLHRRLALPVAPLLFALVGVPLGMRRARGARSYGVLVCVALVFAYYTLLSFGEVLGEEGSLPVLVAIWLPNVAFGLVAAALLRRVRYAEI